MKNRAEKRCEQLTALDMVLNGAEYRGRKDLNRDFNVHFLEVNCDPDNVWDEKIEKLKAEFERRKALNRPIIEHKHTKGEWIIDVTDRAIDANPKYFTLVSNKKNGGKLIALIRDDSDTEKDELYETMANTKLIQIAPQLLQLAEMYFDSMKGTDAEGSIPYQLTLETLNKLK